MGPKFRKKVEEHVRCPREKLREKYGTEWPRRSTNIPSSIRKDFRKEKEKKEREERTNYWRYRIFRKCDENVILHAPGSKYVFLFFFYFILFEYRLSALYSFVGRATRSVSSVEERTLPRAALISALSRDRSRPGACIHARRPASDP